MLALADGMEPLASSRHRTNSEPNITQEEDVRGVPAYVKNAA